MGIDLAAAASFMARHARVLDRRRFAYLLGAADADAVLAAVDGYRNADGGYGWGLEPDLRAPESQPGGALHALEAFADVAPVTTPRAVQVCDWLASVTLADGGLPFALPIADPAGCAPFWVGADPTVATLQSTAFALAAALRVGEHDPAVAEHPWLERATGYCIDAIRRIDDSVHAIELCFAVQVLDAAHDRRPEAPALLERLGAFIPDDGIVPVAGGAEGEALRPLDFAPTPGPARGLFSAETIAAELETLADAQHDDGGWSVDFDSYSPAAALEWRGYKTVSAVSTLLRNGVVAAS
ncbi:hypothetical protein FHX44_111562 [Pseudonocardia hierapolitana]|uniref:Prenyltransferase/squalene oxidase-like repeat protein n=1 Tax=Pseudonocardia hierapolitana TaxID=1128676 RepID=A0A561SLC4_9PSEU|nr:hypothetical protein [Pseudonocardia hierapolitana]TWF75678.1 hypothetical protein FHX44_111562 [Pseudonocardia hierapolitana]